MRVRFSPPIFTVAFCCAYAVVFAMNWQLFFFYPLRGDLAWGWHPMTDAGPATVWYGFMVEAGTAGALAAILVPEAAVAALLRNYLWVFPCGAMLTCAFVLRHFFI